MRAIVFAVIGLCCVALSGCGESRTASASGEEAAVAQAPRAPGVSLYPLSNPQPVAPLQNTAYGPTNLVATAPAYDPVPAGYGTAGYTTDPGYQTVSGEYSTPPYTVVDAVSSGGYYEPAPMTSYTSSVVPMADPQIIVNDPYQTASSGLVSTPTPYSGITTYAEPVPTTTYSTQATYSASSSDYPGYSVSTSTYSDYSTSTPDYSGYAGYSGYSTSTVTTYSTQPVAVPSYDPYGQTAAPATAAPIYSPQTTAYSPSPAPTTYAAPPTSGIPLGGGYRLVPAPDVPSGDYPNDAGPSQWFEIVRPDNGPIQIGRVSATCVCVGVRVPSRYVGAGERALIEARIRSRPPRNNLTYGIYVNIVEPVRQVVDADVTISL